MVNAYRNNGAHNAGIRTGDIILLVNGANVHGHEMAVTFIEQRCTAGDCEVTYHATSTSMDLVHTSAKSMLGAAISIPMAMRRRIGPHPHP